MMELDMVHINAIVFQKEASEEYTICMAGNSGPIIKGNGIEAAKTAFEEALRLHFAICNLNTFNDAVESEKKEQINEKSIRIGKSKPNVNYTERKLQRA